MNVEGVKDVDVKVLFITFIPFRGFVLVLRFFFPVYFWWFVVVGGCEEKRAGLGWTGSDGRRPIFRAGPSGGSVGLTVSRLRVCVSARDFSLSSYLGCLVLYVVAPYPFHLRVSRVTDE